MSYNIVINFRPFTTKHFYSVKICISLRHRCILSNGYQVVFTQGV
jgi:hypothetical protein